MKKRYFTFPGLGILSLLLVACGDKTVYHTVTFDSHGGSEVPSQQVAHGEKVTKPNNPAKLGYDFIDWTCKEERWSFVSFTVTEDITLDANWDTIEYSITYTLNQGTNSPDNPTTYTVEDNITLLEPERTGYTFMGWYNGENKVTSIASGSTGNLSLEARWNEGNTYFVTLDPSGGSVDNTTVDVQYDHSYTLPNPTRDGYKFNGWFDGETLFPANGTWTYTSGKILVANWTIIEYQITYELNSGINSPNNPSKYTVEDNISLADPERTGYSFMGWYNGENKVTSIASGSTGNLSLEARWEAIKYEISIESSDSTKGTVEFNGEGYMDEQITATASPIEGNYFIGWFNDENILFSTEKSLSFTMKAANVDLTAVFWSKEKMDQWKVDHGLELVISNDESTIQYGLYPQTVVEDEQIIEKLDKSETMLNDYYYFYNDELYYKEYAKQYTYYSFNNGNLIENKYYWFKVEPIQWRVLENDGVKVTVISENLLDSTYYDNSSVMYASSHLRNYFNSTFYDKAFLRNEENVLITEVDNSGASTESLTNPYASENTNDKVYTLSWVEANYSEYFKNNADRAAKTTDYSRSINKYSISNNEQTLYNALYWLRSPNPGYENYAIQYVDETGRRNGYVTKESIHATRPMMTLSLEKVAQEEEFFK